MTDKTQQDQSGKATSEKDSAVQYASPACSLQDLVPEMALNNEKAGEKVRQWRKQQRDRLISIRDSLEDARHQALSSSVIDQLQKSGSLNDYMSIAFFWPMRGEIDLRPLMTQLVKQGATAALPVITQRNQPLEFWQWKPGETLSEDGFWGIPVPAVRRPVVPQLLFVPMLGFDDQGHRLGFGGGYYDRSIAAMHPQPLSIGVCCEFGHMHSIYPQAHDIPMNAIASESQFRQFSQPSSG